VFNNSRQDQGNIKKKEELTDEEKEKCMDVSQLIGTERW
jgi:hypothetical protein